MNNQIKFMPTPITDTATLMGRRETVLIEKKNYIEGEIYLNNKQHFNYTKKGATVIIAGSRGGGKTFVGTIIATQFPAGIYLDPQKTAIENLQKQKLINEWSVKVLEEGRQIKNSFKMNAEDISPEFEKIVFTQSTGQAPKLRNIFRRFFKYSKNKRNYELLKKILITSNQRSLWDEIKIILDKNDSAPPLIEIQSKKIMLDYQLGSQHLAPVILLGSLFGQRLRSKKTMPHYCVSIDEIQTNAPTNSYLGKMLLHVFSRGRALNISGVATGTDPNLLPIPVRTNVKVILLFPTRKSVCNHLWKSYEIDVNSTDFDLMHGKENNFFYFNLFGDTERKVSTANKKNMMKADLSMFVKEDEKEKEALEKIKEKMMSQVRCLAY